MKADGSTTIKAKNQGIIQSCSQHLKLPISIKNYKI